MVFVTLPFTDQRTRKRRPAVFVSSERYHQERPDLIILAVTSQVRAAPAVGEAAIGKWKAAELLKPSIRKPLLATIAKGLVGARPAQARAARGGGSAGAARGARRDPRG